MKHLCVLLFIFVPAFVFPIIGLSPPDQEALKSRESRPFKGCDPWHPKNIPRIHTDEVSSHVFAETGLRTRLVHEVGHAIEQGVEVLAEVRREQKRFGDGVTEIGRASCRERVSIDV